MSTRSELYHCFGVGTVEVLRKDFIKGETVFHCQHSPSRLRCPECHGHNLSLRGMVHRLFRLVPIGSRPTWMNFGVRRVECHDCGCLRQENLPFADRYKRYTRTFARHVLELSRIATVKDVARHLGVSWDLVADIQRRRLEIDAGKVPLSEVKHIAIDELAIGKGHHYVSIELDLDTGAAIHVGEGKGIDSVKPFLRKLKRGGVNIKAIATDMGRAFPATAAEVFLEAVLVYDRFHVVKLMNDKLTKLRRDLQREADVLGKKMLKGTRWLLAKTPENLDSKRDETRRLREALEFNQPLAVAYYMKEDLRMFWRQGDKKKAERHLNIWLERAENSGITVLKTMARTLRACRRGLLNWYLHPISTGPLEGFNNKAQTVKRQAYGYRNTEFFMLKLKTLHLKKYALTG